MARKSSKSPTKSKKKKAKDSPGLFARLRDAWGTAIAGLAHVMDHAGRIGAATLIATTLILWIVGADDLQARVTQIRAAEPVVDIKLPLWADASKGDIEPFIIETVREFATFAQTRAGTDPFDHTALVEIQTALARTGWFREGPVVRRLPGNVIRITGDWRGPAAVVRHVDALHLVGLDAVHMRLPSGAPAPTDYLTISHPYSGPPRYNELWTGGDVEDALALLSYLASSPDKGRPFTKADLQQIAGIDLRRYVETGAKSMRLLTRRGATLVWGSVPNSNGPLPGEVDFQTRLERVAMIVTGRARSEDKPGQPLVLNLQTMFIDQVPSGGG